MYDFLLLRINQFETVTQTQNLVYLIQNDLRANVLEVYAGRNLEVTIRGAAEIKVISRIRI